MNNSTISSRVFLKLNWPPFSTTSYFFYQITKKKKLCIVYQKIPRSLELIHLSNRSVRCLHMAPDSSSCCSADSISRAEQILASIPGKATGAYSHSQVIVYCRAFCYLPPGEKGECWHSLFFLIFLGHQRTSWSNCCWDYLTRWIPC